MPKLIDLLDRLPPRPTPWEKGRIDEPVMPFLHRQMDSFGSWVLQRNYELGEPPLSSEEIQVLRTRWRK